MTIKRKIFLTNTIMVLCSLLLLLLLAGGMFELFKGEFLNATTKNQQLESNAYAIETIINAPSTAIGDWGELSQEVGAYGYHLYVMDDAKNTLYSNVDNAESESLESLIDFGWESPGSSQLYLVENVTIIKLSGTNNSGNFSLYATYGAGDYEFLGISRGLIEMFIIAFLFVGGIAVVGILFISQLLTKRLIKSIMLPLDELGKACKRVDEGNLDEPISYENKDEFYEVCQTFDTMQVHLKEGIEQSAAYEKARTDMISGISHDLRTPLTAMKGSVRGILDGVANTPEKQQQYLEIAYQKTCDMDLLLQKLFYFSKLQTGNMPFYKRTINLVDWIGHYVHDRSNEMAQDNWTMEYVPAARKVEICVDTDQLKRVFDNVIENSIKYAKTTNLKVRILVEQTNDKVIITIRDNGSEIDQAIIDHLFEQFYRGDESRNSKQDGNGLGLYICKHIVEQHGGTIKATNHKGMVITIELPKGECNV